MRACKTSSSDETYTYKISVIHTVYVYHFKEQSILLVCQTYEVGKSPALPGNSFLACGFIGNSTDWRVVTAKVSNARRLRQ